MHSIKKQLIEKCEGLLNERLYQVQKSIAAIEEAFASETKSSAGDKHETGRAMLQLEREKAGQRLLEVETLLQNFSKINHAIPSEENNKYIRVGSLVETDGAVYYIAVSLGAVQVNDDTVYCISPQSPIGSLLLGKTVGETFSFNNKTSLILSIF
ncbi:GreA/GreB family elongation factor [Galbibacter mesophilus]|uniref:GreA/GreB family elongation factor n=1 Tax=Galbibacter mesophilus TaxID=379069 RepID=UPI00191D3269|nr:GreA/GreB family elongation factor [Galbibacter mesophilus]MCM5662465.1 GreA/GreB family elongation factor [Galbibacter mesophilus]